MFVTVSTSMYLSTFVYLIMLLTCVVSGSDTVLRKHALPCVILIVYDLFYALKIVHYFTQCLDYL